MPLELEDILVAGEMIRDRWKVTGKIGGGGFGQIYTVYDRQSKCQVAAKVEKCTNRHLVLKMEIAVLRRYQGKPHAPKFVGCGHTDRYNYLIMELLSKNLTQLRRESPQQRLSIGTTFRVVQQGLKSLQDLHTLGYLHRDIKPSNFAIGLAPEALHTVYIIDFGLARQYLVNRGELRQPRDNAAFRGTLRYASLSTHNDKEMGRQDDLWSLFYTLIELANGNLPWRRLRDKEKVRQFKVKMKLERLCRRLPRQTIEIGRHLETLTYYDKPDYALLNMQLDKVLKDQQVNTQDPLDWEENYCKLEKESRTETSSDRKPPSITKVPETGAVAEGPPSNPLDDII